MITATERLGYPADARLLILNGDDIGMCHDTNVGTLAGLRDGLLTSASLMAPCPWALETAELFAGLDVGVHLTITAEWRTYRWGPLTAECRQPASGLVDSTGSFWANDESVARNGSPAAARVEVYRQIEWALDRGLDITKLDGHMGTFYGHPEYLRIYLDAARDFRLPLRLPPLTEYLSRGGAAQAAMIEAEPALLRPDALHGLSLDPAAPIEGKTLELLRGLRPGLTEILLHAARSGDEIRAITSDAPARIEALRLMTESTTIRDCLTSEGISLVGYRELRDAQRAGA